MYTHLCRSVSPVASNPWGLLSRLRKPSPSDPRQVDRRTVGPQDAEALASASLASKLADAARFSLPVPRGAQGNRCPASPQISHRVPRIILAAGMEAVRGLMPHPGDALCGPRGLDQHSEPGKRCCELFATGSRLRSLGGALISNSSPFHQ